MKIARFSQDFMTVSEVNCFMVDDRSTVTCLHKDTCFERDRHIDQAPEA